jgi:aspartyl-tRNA synthetase
MSSEEPKVVVEQQPETVVVEQTLSAEGGDAAAQKPKKEKVKKEPKVRQQPEQPARQTVIVSAVDAEFGDFSLCNSSFTTGRTFAQISDIIPENEGKEVWIRARAQTVRGKGKNCFLQLRSRYDTCQACAFAGAEGPSVEMVKYASKIPTESWVDVFGVISKANVLSCTQKEAEISMKKIFVVSAASNQPPFQLADAMRYDPTYTGLQQDADAGNEDEAKDGAEQIIRVSQNKRLDNRPVDLRTPANQAIFTVQSRIGQFFREFLYKHNFMEIHTPKIIPGVSEGGSEVFSLDYFGTKCCLAQSPQLYKQMVTVADFGRVFEIGHVFRAENSNTHRHLCEFTGLDLEMTINEHYHEALDLIGELFVHIFNRLNETCQKEIAAVNAQYPFEPLRFQEKVVRITFNEAHEMLVAAGEEHGPFDDMSTAQERKLGQLMKAKYDCELYIVDKFPASIRPFYTMPCPVDPRYSNSYDVFLRGEEITSGAQRVHDPVLLKKQAAEKGVPFESLKAYIETFEHGALPHAGCGIGLERMTFLFLGLKNIRLSTLFPRDPRRCAP